MSEGNRPTAAYQYLTLDAARALECNGCGDCCDSRRTDGYWTWGALPESEFADRCDAGPLIIPLERADGVWRDRAWREDDAYELSGTRFRCSAFHAAEDGRGSCSRHDQWRPALCGEFPVWGDELPGELAAHGEVALPTDALTRCTWYHVIVVSAGDARLAAR